MRSSLLKCLCVLLVLQSSLSNAVSGHNLRMLNAQNQQNVLVICTGKATKWIDSEVYFASGLIVDVQPPSDIDYDDISLACFSSLSFDQKPVIVNLPAFGSTLASNHLKLVLPVSQHLASNNLLLRPASRAPPFRYFTNT